MSESSCLIRNRFYEVVVDAKNGHWSLKDRASDLWVFRDAIFQVDRMPGQRWTEPQPVVSFEKERFSVSQGKGIKLTVSYVPSEGYSPVRMLMLRLWNTRPHIEIGWGIENRFAYPVRVCHVDLAYFGALFVDQTVTSAHVLRSGAGAEANAVEKGWQIEAHNGAMLTYLDRGRRRTLVAGGLAYREFGRLIRLQDGETGPGVRVRNQGYRNIGLSCFDPQGRIIAPGETYWSADTVYVSTAIADPFEALETYGLALREANGASPNVYDFPTLCGWMVSTKHLGEGKPINHSPGLVEQTHLARERGLMKYTPLAVRLEPDTYCYGNFGDTQQGWWDDEHWRLYAPGNGHHAGTQPGSLRAPYETFAKFCKAVKSLGGIPFTYFQSSMPSNDFAVAHPDWMLGKDITRLHYTHPHQKPFVRYDYTHPVFRAYCLKVWKRLRKAGLQGVKFDYPESAWASQGGFTDQTYTTTSAYREMYRLCREGLGPDAFIHERNLGGPSHENVPLLDATAGIVDIQRVWGDASHFEPEMASRMGLRWFKSRSVFLYYPDGKSFYMNGKPLAAYKRRAFLTIMAFLSGRLEIGTSISSMTDEMFHDVTRLFPMFGGVQSPRPVDMLTGGQHPSVYVYKVSEDWRQVMLLNNRKSSRLVTVPLCGCQADTGAIGVDQDAAYHAFDFWNQTYLGLRHGSASIGVKLRGGEAAMIAVRKRLNHPQILSTNRHLMQGMLETHGVRWNHTKDVLSGRVDVIGGEAFVLTIACNGWRLSKCMGADIHKRADDESLLDVVFASDMNERMSFQLFFKGG